MKWIIAILLIASPACAQSVGEKIGVNQMLDRAPTGSDVLLELHQFDLFQQSTTDSSDKRGDDAVKKFAVAQSDAADKREKQLTALQKKARLDITFADEPNADRSSRLAGLDGAVGEKYLANFYAAEITEHEAAISLLTRYNTKPDNEDIRALAEKLLPALQGGLKQLQLTAPKQ
jgi:putative membrane protein